MMGLKGGTQIIALMLSAQGGNMEGVKYDAGKVRWSLVPEGVM
jgi:hypothetical protein